MRLINAEKLFFEISRNAFKVANSWDEPFVCIGFEMGVHHVMNLIASFPQVDAVLVRHGKWLDGCCEVKCSCCGETYSDEIFLMRGEINYCPNCGAKMEGGEENA